MGSIWTQDISLPQFPVLPGDLKTDVLVIGGGIAGLLCAYQLKKAGASCILLEGQQIARGVTAGTTAKLTVQHGLIYHRLLNRFGKNTAQGYLLANRRGLDEYFKLCPALDCDFIPQDNYIYSTQNRQRLEAELKALDAIGCPANFAKDLPLPIPTLGAVRMTGQAQFHPLKFLTAIARDLQIYENTPVRTLEGSAAVTDRGKIRADAIIVATHFPFRNTHGSYFLKLYQQRSYVLSLSRAQKLEGMYLDEGEQRLSFRSFQGQLLLGGGGHRTGKPGGGWAELEAFSRLHYPGAIITHRWAAQDCMTLDGMPYIGKYSAPMKNLFVATGFNKWGMTSAMAAAQILTEWITTGRSPYEEIFSPSRSMLHPQLAVNAMEAAVSLLTPTGKRCPHMGCALKWNPQEHSWDCPCHGSRFAEDGTLLDNPATGDRKNS